MTSFQLRSLSRWSPTNHALCSLPENMWSVVQLGGGESEKTPRGRNTVPTSRSKHAMCVGQDGFFYMLGGKSANLPMKDLWRFDPGTSERVPAIFSIIRSAETMECARDLGDNI